MALRVGDLGIDYSGWRMDTAKKVSEFRKAKGRFIIRYSAGAGNTQPSTQWKLCGKNEIAQAVARGFDFIANSEWYESRVTEGAAAGKADGKADLKFWKSRGLAKGASIYVSWDENPARAKWDAAVAYLRAYDKALGGYYHVDGYGGTQFLKYAISKGVIRYGWRTNAGSWSNDGLPYAPGDPVQHAQAACDATPAHIWQTGNYWFSKNADENLILRTPVGSHLEAIGGDDDMPTPKELWYWDGLPNPSGENLKDNPTWAPASVLEYAYKNAKTAAVLAADADKRVAALQKAIADLAAEVKALKESGSVTVTPTDVPATLHIGGKK